MIFGWFSKFWNKSNKTKRIYFYNSNQTWDDYYKAKANYEKRNKNDRELT